MSDERRAGNDVLLLKLDLLGESQSRTEKKVDEILGNLHDPDEGIYTRVNKNTGFRRSAVKWIGAVGGLALAGVVKSFWSVLIGR